MKINALLTDPAVLAELGRRMARIRLDLNITQGELARRAGVGKRTIERLEAGESVQLTSFIRACRVLELMDAIDAMIAEPEPGPYDLLKLRGRERQRASGLHAGDMMAAEDELPPGPWVWGEDR